MKRELLWGCAIGAVSQLWWNGTFFMGWHDRGPFGLQLAAMVSMGLVFLGSAMGILKLHGPKVVEARGDLQARDGVQTGAIMALGTIAVVFLGFCLYFFAINPDFGAKFYERLSAVSPEDGGRVPKGLTPEEVEQTFGFKAFTPFHTLFALFMALLGTVMALCGLKVVTRKLRTA